MEFQQDWLKDKKFTAFSIFWQKTVKFHSAEHYGAPLEGSTIFLSRSSTCRMSIGKLSISRVEICIFQKDRM